MLNVPKTYPEWNQLLTKLKNKTDDREVLFAMQRGTLEWQSGVAERFTNKLVDAINSRMNDASDKFQKTMGRPGGDSQVIMALDGLRKEYYFLCQCVDLPCLPPDIKKQYIGLIVDQANKTQESLEDSARRDRTGRLRFLVKQHAVNNF